MTAAKAAKASPALKPAGAALKKANAALAAMKREGADFYQLRLYVAGRTTRAASALRNLEAICETHLQGKYKIEVVDLLVNPQLARGDQIFAVPTLVRQLPPPVKKIIGDLSNVERVLVGLDLRPVQKGSR
jgi:circadian clock protein KaiB